MSPSGALAHAEGVLAVLGARGAAAAHALAAHEAAAARQHEVARAARRLQLPTAVLRNTRGRGALYHADTLIPTGSTAASTGVSTGADTGVSTASRTGGVITTAAGTALSTGERGVSAAGPAAASAVLGLTEATLSVLRRRRTTPTAASAMPATAAHTSTPAAPVADESDIDAHADTDADADAAVSAEAEAAAAKASAKASAAWEGARAGARSVGPAQAQVLAREGRALEERLGDLAHEVGQAETTIMELSRMQHDMAMHLAAQEEKVMSVQTDTADAIANVEAGNDDLAQALKYNRDFRWAMLLVFLLLSASLLFLDFYYS